MYVMVSKQRTLLYDGGGGGCVCVCVCMCVCVCVCVCAWSGWFLLKSPEMKLAFLLQFISR